MTSSPAPVDLLVVVLDLAGTAVFAVSGAGVGVKYGLDIFGVCVLAFVAGSGGGMMRDLLMGAVPPPGREPVGVHGGGLARGRRHVPVASARGAPARPILLFDAAGLGLFAVAGTQKAPAFG